MLPSLGFQEILLLGILALVVVGPKDLPLMLRKLGRWTARLRGMAQEFRTGFDELARQAELDELKKEVDALRRNNVLNEINREISKPVDFAAPPPPPPAIPHDAAHAGAAKPDESAPPQPSAPDAPEEAAPAEPVEAPKARSASS